MVFIVRVEGVDNKRVDYIVNVLINVTEKDEVGKKVENIGDVI